MRVPGRRYIGASKTNGLEIVRYLVPLGIEPIGKQTPCQGQSFDVEKINRELIKKRPPHRLAGADVWAPFPGRELLFLRRAEHRAHLCLGRRDGFDIRQAV
jgi:hypothetical protein